VGVGTGSPQYNLDVAGTAPYLSITDTRTSSGGTTGLDLGGIVFRTKDNTDPIPETGDFLAKIQVTAVNSGSFPDGSLNFFVSDDGDLLSIPSMVIQGITGNVGIGTTSPACPLHIKQSGTDGGGTPNAEQQSQTGITVERSDAANRWMQGINGLNDYLFWYDADGSGTATSKAFFDNDGTNNVDQNFTGQHRTFIKDIPFTRAVELEGLIVSADNNKYIKMTGGIEVGSNAITTNESLPVVSLSTRVNDKKCFGVISASEDPETRENRFGNIVSVSQKELGDTRVYINSVGEGAMWVTNINGPLESGDYITTSNVAGYGQKQDDDILHNYTVAKITMDCDFEPATDASLKAFSYFSITPPPH
jgi:hypothetical protein